MNVLVSILFIFPKQAREHEAKEALAAAVVANSIDQLESGMKALADSHLGKISNVNVSFCICLQ